MSALVLVLGGASLMIVLAGFSGLKTFSLSFSSYFDPDLKIFPKEGKFITADSTQIAQLKNIEGVAFYSQVIEEKVFLSHNQKNFIGHIKGVDSQYDKVNQMDSILVVPTDKFIEDEHLVVVGRSIALHLNLGLYNTESPLQIIVPKAGKGSIFNNEKPYKEVKVLACNYFQVSEDLDSKYVFSSLNLARFLLDLPKHHISAIEVKTHKNTDEKQIISEIQKAFNQEVIVKNRFQINQDIYKMLNTENLATYLIFTLVLIIALFNLISAMIMTILDKKNNLKTLFALGVPLAKMRQIFFLQGFIISFLGAIFGVILGTFIAWLQLKYSLLIINPNSEFPLAYPVEIRWKDILLVFTTILTLGTICSWVGSSRVRSEFLHKK